MKIICHRGLWKKPKEQNGIKACIEGMNDFNGIEIDLKNKLGKIVLSHDPIVKNQKPIELESLFAKNTSSFYALNIKEDGLGPELMRLIKMYKIKNYMCFDLSSPENYQYQKLKLTCYDRYGDQDEKKRMIASGLVVDIFDQEKEGKILASLKDISPNIPLFIISPELHQREHIHQWKKVQKLTQSQVFLCTDLPEEAKLFFK